MTELADSISNGTQYRVRYADTDKMQYMYNGNYLTLFEIGRTEMLRAAGLPYVELENAGYLLPVLEAKVQYRLPAFYDDQLTIIASYKPERRPIITISYRILRAADVIAEGYTIHAFVNSVTRKPVRPPSTFFELIDRFIQEQKQSL
jgi:acyl-CoA thioester hydrolase